MGLREARREEVPLIVAMLLDDHLGKGREDMSDMTPYLKAFDAIAADPFNTQYVWDENGEVLGCLQLTVIPGISQQGAWRAQIEGVRVSGAKRGTGIGHKQDDARDHGDRARARLRADAAYHQQGAARRAALLRDARLREVARRHEGEALT